MTMKRRLFVAITFALVGLGTRAGRAQEQNEAGAARAAHVERMRALASTFQVLADADNSKSQVEMPAQPALRYADSTRQTHESALWIWCSRGRPTAVMVLEFYPDDQRGPQWLYEIASLAGKRIAARRGDDWAWSAKQPGLEMQPLSGADVPAARTGQRLVQMKKLRDRFTAHERANIEGRIELRPLASPLVRWDDAEAGVLDGALFAFASGTNPEVLLALEAHEMDGKSVWQYGLVQLSGEPLTAQLEGKDIWHAEAAVPPASRPSYTNGWLAAEANSRP